MKNLKINYLFVLSILFSIQTTLADGPVFKEPIYLKGVYKQKFYGKYTFVVTLKMEENKPIADMYDYNHSSHRISDGNIPKEKVWLSGNKNYMWGDGYYIDRKDLILKKYSTMGAGQYSWGKGGTLGIVYSTKIERISLEDFLKLKEEHLIIKNRADALKKQKQKELEDEFKI